jgi:Fur family ferric uptake transcriptional regulator
MVVVRAAAAARSLLQPTHVCDDVCRDQHGGETQASATAIDPATASPQELQLVLRRAGLRATPARVAVLNALYRSQAPLSHADVGDLLDEALWDRATLFRNLTDLAKAGLARRVDLGDHIWRFEAQTAGHQPTAHPHFVCTACGTVECVPGLQLVADQASASMPLLDQRFEIQLKGLCDGCR